MIVYSKIYKFNRIFNFAHFTMFKIMPKEEYEAINKLSKINFLALETLENSMEDRVTITTYMKAMK